MVEAVKLEANLIILGITHNRKFGEFDLGRTAPYVLKNAPCRVWLARAAAPVGATPGTETVATTGR